MEVQNIPKITLKIIPTEISLQHLPFHFSYLNLQDFKKLVGFLLIKFN